MNKVLVILKETFLRLAKRKMVKVLIAEAESVFIVESQGTLNELTETEGRHVGYIAHHKAGYFNDRIIRGLHDISNTTTEELFTLSNAFTRIANARDEEDDMLRRCLELPASPALDRDYGVGIPLRVPWLQAQSFAGMMMSMHTFWVRIRIPY